MAAGLLGDTTIFSFVLGDYGAVRSPILEDAILIKCQIIQSNIPQIRPASAFSEHCQEGNNGPKKLQKRNPKPPSLPKRPFHRAHHLLFRNIAKRSGGADN